MGSGSLAQPREILLSREKEEMGEVEKITDGIHEAFTASQGANNNLVNSVDIKWQKNDGFLHFI